MKYKDWLEEWLANYVRPSSKAKTFSRYTEISKQHLIPKLGEYELDELKPLILQRFVTGLLQNGNLKTGEGLSANSVNSIISVIQGSLRVANNLGYSTYFGADKIRRPKINGKQVTCFSNIEQKKIEQAMDDREVLERMFASKNGDMLRRLYQGEDIRNNRSNTDMVWFNHLAFWCAHDPDQMQRINATSGLYRKDKPQSYYDHTTLKAIKSTPVYTPPKASNSAPQSSGGSGNGKA